MKNQINHKICLRKGKCFSIILALFLFSLMSCDNDDGVVLTKTELLTSSPWIFDGIDSGNPSADALSAAFLTGATFTFTITGTYEFTFLDSSNNNNGLWEFSGDERSIILEKNTKDEDDWSILALNANQLHISFVDLDLGTTVEILFRH